MKHVVVIGGGTGTFTLLSALRDSPYKISALLTMVDDGGSNRVLRDEFGLLPTSGVRQALVALSSTPSLLRELFLYRFHQGNGIKGMTFGNLFLAAVADIVGSQEEAIEQTAQLLSVKGDILPISYDDVRLVAQYENGLEVVGEHAIDEPKHDGKLKIVKMYTKPKATINEKAMHAIKTADYIFLGPGDFYTNTVANLIIDGVCEAIINSSAHVVFIGNLMTKYGETYNYATSDFLEVLKEYIPINRIGTILLNNDHSFPEEALEKYKQEHSMPVKDDLDSYDLPSSVQVIRTPLLLDEEIKPQKGDSVKRSIIRHDSDKLMSALKKIIV